MWEGIDAAQTTKRDLTWLVEGMKSNTLVWVTDGLYNQKKGSRLEQSWLDNILKQNGVTADRHFQGMVPGGKFIPSRNAWLMRRAPLCQSAFGVPQDPGVESYVVMQQQEST